MVIIYFDVITRLFKSYTQTSNPETLPPTNDLIVSVDDTVLTQYKDKWSQLKLNLDNSLSVIEQRPTPYHYYNGVEWVINEDEQQRILAGNARDLRLGLLKELDDLVLNPLRYASYSDEIKLQLADYRQSLLDIPQQTGFPLNVIWPEKPSTLN